MSTFNKFHPENLKYDKRLIRMNEKSGLLAPGEYKKSIEDLPDLQHNAVPMSFKSGAEAGEVEESPVAEGFSDGLTPAPEAQSGSFSAGEETDSVVETTPKPDNSGGGGGFFGGF